MTPLERMEAELERNPHIGRIVLSKLAGVGDKTARKFLNSKRGKTHPITLVSLTDWHCPYHDEKALSAAVNFCAHTQPQHIVLHEVHDFYTLSRFDQNPARANRLQDEIDSAYEWMKKLREACPKAEIRLLGSNHLDRLRKYLWAQARGLSGLRALEIPALLLLPELRINYMQDWTFRGFWFKHGDIARKHSGYTARGELEKEGVSGASGHTHRLAAHYKTLRGGEYVWVESGCLCDMNPDYINGRPDWQHGLSVVMFEPEGSHFVALPLPIINGKILWGSEVIT